MIYIGENVIGAYGMKIFVKVNMPVLKHLILCMPFTIKKNQKSKTKEQST